MATADEIAVGIVAVAGIDLAEAAAAVAVAAGGVKSRRFTVVFERITTAGLRPLPFLAPPGFNTDAIGEIGLAATTPFHDIIQKVRRSLPRDGC